MGQAGSHRFGRSGRFVDGGLKGINKGLHVIIYDAYGDKGVYLKEYT